MSLIKNGAVDKEKLPRVQLGPAVKDWVGSFQGGALPTRLLGFGISVPRARTWKFSHVTGTDATVHMYIHVCTYTVSSMGDVFLDR